METIILEQPKEVRIRLLGHDILLTITEASDKEVGEWLNGCTVDTDELGYIQSELCMHRLCGEFEAVSMRLYSLQDRQPVRYNGTWQIIPDYRQAARIMMWKYNYVPAEALTLKSFQDTYGEMLGRHFYGKWVSYEKSIEKMIGYFGRNLTAGQKFIDMIMRNVAHYERRIICEE